MLCFCTHLCAFRSFWCCCRSDFCMHGSPAQAQFLSFRFLWGYFPCHTRYQGIGFLLVSFPLLFLLFLLSFFALFFLHFVLPFLFCFSLYFYSCRVFFRSYAFLYLLLFFSYLCWLGSTGNWQELYDAQHIVDRMVHDTREDSLQHQRCDPLDDFRRCVDAVNNRHASNVVNPNPSLVLPCLV